MKLKNQIIELGADAQNDLANDVKESGVFGIDRAVTGRTSGQEQVGILRRNG